MRRRRRDRKVAVPDAVALPDLPRIRPRMQMLERSHCLQIHQASCQILRKTGVEVFHEEGLELLHSAGAHIEEDLARISPSLVESALATAPSQFNLYRRGGQEIATVLDGEQVYFGPGSDTLRYLDPETGHHRDFVLSDIADCIRVCDALPEIGFVMSVGIPRDVPTKIKRFFID